MFKKVRREKNIAETINERFSYQYGRIIKALSPYCTEKIVLMVITNLSYIEETNKKIEQLIKAGAFDCLDKSRGKLMANLGHSLYGTWRYGSHPR